MNAQHWPLADVKALINRYFVCVFYSVTYAFRENLYSVIVCIWLNE